MAREGTLWLVDWSDSEDEDFRAACAAAGVQARVLRGPALGTTVGTRWHRLRSWPTYGLLALRGLRDARGAVLVAWQPIAGALAGLARRGRQPPLVVLNPLLDPGSSSARQRALLAGAARADRVLFFSRRSLDAAAALGLERSRLRFVPLGVRASPEWTPPTDDFLVAVGREERDWPTLARAAQDLPAEVVVVGPAALPEPGPLRVLPQRTRTELAELIRAARGVVVPLRPTERPAGQLAILDAMAAGRAVVATRAPGTEDYVTGATGLLVPAGDPAALREALLRLLEPGVAESLGVAAHAAACGELSLERFVEAVDAEARSL